MRGTARWSTLGALASLTAIACSTTHRYAFYDGSELPSTAPAEIEAANVLAFYSFDPDTVVQRLGADACCGSVHLTVRPGGYRITIQSWMKFDVVRCTLGSCHPTGEKAKPSCTVGFTAAAGAKYRVQGYLAGALSPHQFGVVQGNFHVSVYQRTALDTEQVIAECEAR